MKNFHQNLLVVLASALCALCVYQWHGQTRQRTQIERLNQLVYEKSLAIRNDTNSLSLLNHQVAQMDARITELKRTVETNEQFVAVQRREISRLQAADEALTNRIVEYQNAVDSLEAKLKEAYGGIRKQNESLAELVAQRDEFVKKYNDSVKERNEIVAKYNDLAAQVEKQQSGGGSK
jgi:chromosome segregation ATPase